MPEVLKNFCVPFLGWGWGFRNFVENWVLEVTFLHQFGMFYSLFCIKMIKYSCVHFKNAARFSITNCNSSIGAPLAFSLGGGGSVLGVRWFSKHQNKTSINALAVDAREKNRLWKIGLWALRSFELVNLGCLLRLLT